MRGVARIADQRHDRPVARLDRIPCDRRLRDGGHRWRAPVSRDGHHAPTIDVTNVRVVNHTFTVVTRRYEFHFAVARREFSWCAAGRRDAPEMHPARALPREHDAIVGAPLQLIVSHDGPVCTAATRCRAEDLLRISGRDVGHLNAPRLRAASRAKSETLAFIWHAQERDPRTVARPDGRIIAVGTRRDPQQRLLRDGVDADEAVRAAIGDERKLLTVR